MRGNRIRLEPFAPGDFSRLINWVDSAESLVQFAGPIFDFPLTELQLFDYLKQSDKEALKIVLIDSDEVIGHCEINRGNKYPRLSRILIGDESKRGSGLGEEVVYQMVIKILNDTPEAHIIDLNVFSWNKAAIRCYEKVGFKIIEAHTDTLRVHGLEWTRLNMQYVI